LSSINQNINSETMATKLKFTPSPGYIFVKPEDDDNSYFKFINKGTADDRRLSRGRIVAIPAPEKVNLRGGKEVMPISGENVTAKVGDVILYCSEYAYCFEANDEEYHLIDNYSVKAKL